MFGLGWAEIMVAAVVGLIVIGPKELPVVFRKIGQFVGKAKGMARDFSRAMNDAADDSGMKDAMGSMHSLKDEVRSVTDPTTKWKDFAPGSETAKLAAEGAKKSKKIHGATAVNPQGRLDAAKSTNTVLETNSAPEKGKNSGENSKAKNSVVKKLVTTKGPAKPTLEKKTLVNSKKVATKKNTLSKTALKSGKTK